MLTLDDFPFSVDQGQEEDNMAVPFHRSPRMIQELPKGEVNIPAPPQAPTPPSLSLFTIILPVVATLLGFGVMIYYSKSNSMMYLGFSLPMMAASYIVAFYNYYTTKKNYREAMSKRENTYLSALQSLREQLEAFQQRQRDVLTQAHPPISGCLERVKRQARSLWERVPKDPDFLSLRLGLGRLPLTVSIKVPTPYTATEPDPLQNSAEELCKQACQVKNVPICLPLKVVGIAGLVGSRAAVLNLTRVLALQITTNHAPDEVKLVAIFPENEAAEWQWLRWLPHTWSEDRQIRYLAQTKAEAHELLNHLYERMNYRKLQQGDSLPLPHYIFLLGNADLLEKEALLPLLLTDGPSIGAYTLVTASSLKVLPKECQAIVEVGEQRAKLIQTTPSLAEYPCKADQVSSHLAEQFARKLATLKLQSLGHSTEIPKKLPLLDLLDIKRVEELDLARRWATSEPYKTLAAPIGVRSGGEKLWFNLHERGHGPHGLVAGTTGSGKSELLQTMIAAQAVYYHPHELAFVLVDYKGGGMSNAFAELPHLIGTITNLQGNLAMRALAALKGELLRRQALLSQVHVNHVDDYQRLHRKGQAPEPLPHLVIIVDEFAELKTELPEFMRELVSAVRVGRSLGIHLILATQKPAGVVDEQIWSNTRFRLCLRVERPEDSREVLKRPDAANLADPGRAFFQMGNDEIFELFQAALSTAPYDPEDTHAPDPNEIFVVTLDGKRHSLSKRPKVKRKAKLNQLQALVTYLQHSAAQQGLQRLKGPWLPPLPERLFLSEVRGGPQGWAGQHWQPGNRWLEPILGMKDHPAQQAQDPLTVNLGKEGHLAVYGAPGSGKTTLLQTLVLSLALDHSPEDVHIYIMDFGGRMLSIFEALPHVGGVVLADQAEKVQRLLKFLLQELEKRKELFAEVGVSTLLAFRSADPRNLPALVLLLDNYPGFINTYPDAEDMLAKIAREGGNLGVHIILTATSYSAVRLKTGGNISMAVALQLTDRSEYHVAVGRTQGLEPAPFPGRGLIKGTPPLEFHTALPSPGETEVERTQALKQGMASLSQGWQGSRAKAIPALPEVLPLAELLGQHCPKVANQGTFSVPLGLDVEELEPVYLDLQEGPFFLIAGSVESGKTSLLQTWALALAETYAPEQLQLYLVDFYRTLSPLDRLPQVQAYVRENEQLSDMVDRLAEQLNERRLALEEARNKDPLLNDRTFLSQFPALVIVMDDCDSVHKQNEYGAVKDKLEQMVRRERGMGVYILAAGNNSNLDKVYDGWLKSMRELKTGFLLGSGEYSQSLLNIRLSLEESGRTWPPGRGYYGRRGRAVKLHTATAQQGPLPLALWVEGIAKRYGRT